MRKDKFMGYMVAGETLDGRLVVHPRDFDDPSEFFTSFAEIEEFLTGFSGHYTITEVYKNSLDDKYYELIREFRYKGKPTLIK